MTTAETAEAEQLRTIDELSEETGLSVRTTRYYATRGLIPPPVRRGRIGYYGPEHRARLDLVRALQDHGFTLQAIEGYLSRLPADASPADLAVERTLITSWTSESKEDVEARMVAELRGLGLPADALASAGEVIHRHTEALADELTEIFRTQVVEPFRRTPHTDEEAERLEQALPRLRQLAVEAIADGFRTAANGVITRELSGTEG